MLSGMDRLQLAPSSVPPGGLLSGELFSLELDGTWRVAWTLVLVGFASGALLGLRFERESFLGGYGSWRRRLLRLGHIACIALALLQMAYALSPAAHGAVALGGSCRWLWAFGSLSMPLVCWLSAWRRGFRHLFFAPVASLLAAATLTLMALGRAGETLT